MSETRKIAEILVADIVGYSPLAGAPEGPLRISARTSRSAFSRTVMQITPTRPAVCLGVISRSLDVLDRPPDHARRVDIRN
jgi:hypothetical protein